MNYVEALDHPDLFGPWFDGASWHAWRVLSAAIFGLPIGEPDLPLFRELTGRDEPPVEPCREAFVIAGRRSGKSRQAATIAVYLATLGVELFGWRERLAPGERGVILLLAVDRAQAAITLGYAKALLTEVPMLRPLVEREDSTSIDLTNRTTLMVGTADFRSPRGRTLFCVIMDEVAYLRSEQTARPDVEVFRAVQPALASMPR